MTPVPSFKERQVIWNEEIHTFSPLGSNRFIHYVRKIGERSVADRPGKPQFMSGLEVKNWIIEHNPPALTYIDVEKAKYDMNTKGQFGPEDNLKQEKP